MKNIINLTSIYIKQIVGQMLQSKKNKFAKSYLFLIGIFAIMALAIGFAFFGIAQSFKAVGKSELILFVGLLFSVFTILLINVNDSQNQYYKNRDYSFLSSLPIKPTNIIIAKYLSSYFISFMYSIAIIFPAYVVYFIFNPVIIASVVYAVLALFILPTFSQLIGSIFASIINFITIKFKNKTLINNILTIVFTITLMAFIFISSNSDFMSNFFMNGIPLWIKIVFSHIYFLFMAITTGHFVYFVIFLAITFFYALISITLISISYIKINNKLQTNYAKHSNKPYKYNQKSIFKSLIHKESSNFFNSAIYIINCMVGLFILIAFSISLGIAGNNIVSANALPKELIICIFASASGILVSMTPTTSSSISIEGNKFVVYKSLPISFKMIAISKIMFSIFIHLPFIIISNIIFFSIFTCSFTQIIVVIIANIITCLTFAILGLLTNLKWPRLNWNNEAQAVKQGLSVFLTLATSMVTNIIPILLYFFLYFEINFYFTFEIFYLFFIILLLILLTTFIILLIKCGKKLYSKIY